MDESPINKLVEHATAAHIAVTQQRAAAKYVAEQARQSEQQPPQTQSTGGNEQ